MLSPAAAWPGRAPRAASERNENLDGEPADVKVTRNAAGESVEHGAVVLTDSSLGDERRMSSAPAH